MGLYYNGTYVNPSANVYFNSQACGKVYYNSTLVWTRSAQLHPGQSWEYYVNQNDGGSGREAQAYLADANTMTLIGGYDGSSARCAKWVDIGPWSTLSITFSYTSLSYFQFRWGIYGSNQTNIYGANEIRVTRQDAPSGNFAGTHTINVADLSGGVYIMVYLYAGSHLAGNHVNISNVTLS